MSRRSRTSRSDTIEAVARAAGVSSMTVSRVLRDTGDVSAATRARVQQAMQSIGYVPNQLASALASSHSSQMAVLVPSIANIVFTEVLAGVADRLSGTRFQSVIGVTDYDAAREYELVRSMLAWRCAGLVLAHPTHLPDTETLLARSGIPVVELMALKDRPIDLCVGLDQKAAGRCMARHLLQKGYRKFAYLGTDHRRDTSAGLRFQAFRDVIRRAGGQLLGKRLVDDSSGISLGREHLGALLECTPGVEAVYFSNDAVAAGAMMYCQANDIPVPDSLALASFGGMEIATALPVPLTTVRSPRYDMGRIGVGHLLDRLDGKVVSRHTDVGFELIEGQSS